MTDNNEVHQKSPNETIGQFLVWMFQKAQNDHQPVLGQIDGKTYRITPDPASLAEVIDLYIYHKGPTDLTN